MVSDVVNFLAHLHVFEEGYQYRSLNSYQSAILSVYTKVDGYSVGKYPLVVWLLRGPSISVPHNLDVKQHGM